MLHILIKQAFWYFQKILSLINTSNLDKYMELTIGNILALEGNCENCATAQYIPNDILEQRTHSALGSLN